MEGSIYPPAHLIPDLSRFPLGGGPCEPGRATATCYCGDVSIEFPTDPSEILSALICHCTDCHKISSSLYCSIFGVPTSSLGHLRGEDKLKSYTKSGTTLSGHDMTSYFCSTCGSLMYRRSSATPERTLMRLGTVDDFTLKEGLLKPRIEQFTANRETWLRPVDGIKQVPGSAFPPRASPNGTSPSSTRPVAPPLLVPAPAPAPVTPMEEDSQPDCDIDSDS